jgi:hypothetical protein
VQTYGQRGRCSPQESPMRSLLPSRRGPPLLGTRASSLSLPHKPEPRAFGLSCGCKGDRGGWGLARVTKTQLPSAPKGT